MNDSLASDQTSAGPASSAFETALKGAQEGAADAMEAAKQLIPAAGRFFENFGYNSGYAVAFGVVFPAALIARLFPSDNPVAHGFVDGAAQPSIWCGNPRKPARMPPHRIPCRPPPEQIVKSGSSSSDLEVSAALSPRGRALAP